MIRIICMMLLCVSTLRGQSPFGGGSAGGLEINSLAEADAVRKSTIQALQVAQNPLHSKQDKASKAEIDAYVSAVRKVEAFKAWLITDYSCSVSLKSDAANSPLHRKAFAKAVWEIKGASLKTEPPFTRKDIGVAVKMMNDVREVVLLPIEFSSGPLPDRSN
jgi:hypothetical protein